MMPNLPYRRARLRLAIVALLTLACLPSSAVGDWESTGPDGGWVTSLFYPLGPEGPLLAGTYGGGLYRTDDRGDTWTDVSGGLRGSIVNDIDGEGFPNGWMYVATSEGGIHRGSRLDGSWFPINVGLSQNFGLPGVAGVALNPANTAEMMVATTDGVHSTLNFGSTWPDSMWGFAGSSVTDVEASLTQPGRFFFSSSQEVFRADDPTRNFRNIGNGLSGVLIMDLEVWPDTADHLLAASLTRGLYLNQNQSSFTHIGPTSDPLTDPLLRTVRATGDDVYLGSEVGVHHSPNRGVTWSLVDDGLSTNFAEVWAIAIEDATTGNLMLGTFGRGFLRTGPGGQNWQAKNRGLIATWITEIAVAGDLVLAATRNGRLFASFDRGQTWEDRTGNIDSLGILSVQIHRTDGRWIVGTLESVYRSSDGGASWSRPQSGYPAFLSARRLIQPSWLDPNVVYAATGAGAYWSKDFGAEWEKLPGTSDQNFLVAEASFNDQVIWFGAITGELFSGAHLGNFQEVALSPSLSGPFKALLFPDGNSDHFLAATYQDFHEYQNLSRTRSLSSGLPDAPVGDLLMVEETGQLYAAMEDGGVWRSSNLGQTWGPYNDGLSVQRCRSLVRSTGSEPRLYVGTQAKGVFSRDLETGVAVALSAPHARWEAGRVIIEFGVGAVPSIAEPWLWLGRRAEGGSSTSTELWRGPADRAHRVVDELAGLDAVAAHDLYYTLELHTGPGEGAEVVATASVHLKAPARGVAISRLLPNVPNPFNPRTQFRLEVAHASRVRVDVLDVRGRRVRRMLDAHLPAGPHQLVWDATDDHGAALPSGVYVVWMDAGGRVDSRRVTLLR